MVAPVLFLPPPGLGESPHPHGEAVYKTAKKTFFVTLSLFVGTNLFYLYSPKVINTSRSYFSLGNLALNVTLGLTTLRAFKSLLNARSLRSGIKNPSSYSPCDQKGTSLICKSEDSKSWKYQLIQNAKHNVIISGSFCEGKHYSEILELLRHKLNNISHFKVLLIASHPFNPSEHKEKLKLLKSTFPERFNLVTTTPTLISLPNQLKFSNNHIKAVCIDFGTYFMVGSSNIDDRSQIQENVTSHKTVIATQFLELDTIHYSSHPNGNGTYLYKNLLQLAERWQGISNPGKSEESLPEISLPKYHSSSYPTTHFTMFHRNSLSTRTSTQLYFSSPEHVTSHILQALLKKINSAKKNIFICELYFHPPKDIFKALIEAVKRGVKIKIITNGYNSKRDSMGQHLFGKFNKSELRRLLSSVPLKQKKNVTAYTINFDSKETYTLHTKVIIIDDSVMYGSGNLGHKSLKSLSDNEIFLVTTSKEFSNSTTKTINALIPSENRLQIEANTYFFTDLFYSLIYTLTKKLVD